jgi:hypothetical protein
MDLNYDGIYIPFKYIFTKIIIIKNKFILFSIIKVLFKNILIIYFLDYLNQSNPGGLLPW